MPNDYAAGQVWRYHTRPGEEGSLLKIHAAEPYGDDSVFHVTLSGLGVPLGHLPVSREALDQSVAGPAEAADAAFPDPGEGLAAWRAAEGGVFTLPVAMIVQLMDDAAAGVGGLGVRYIRIDYGHADPDKPACLLFEVQPDGRVTRMIHLFEDGRFGAFDAAEEGVDNLVHGPFFEIWAGLEPGVTKTEGDETFTLDEADPADFDYFWQAWEGAEPQA